MTNITKNDHNLCEPLLMSIGDALNYCKRNVCIDDHGSLEVLRDTSSRMKNQYKVRCVMCKKLIKEGDAISLGTLAKVEQNQYIGESEMRDPPKMTREQALKDLGF